MWEVAIVVASDRAAKGERKDDTGPVIQKAIEEQIDCTITSYRILPDDIETIMENMIEITDRHRADLLLTIGGTGLSPGDVTPEATRQLIDRQVPGMAEEMRRKAMESSRQAMFTRAICGTRGNTLVINLPGSTDEAQYCLHSIIDQLPNALEVIQDGQ